MHCLFQLFFREIFEHYDDKYLKHWFQRDPERKDEELLEFYEKILLEQVRHRAVWYGVLRCGGVCIGVVWYSSS